MASSCTLTTTEEDSQILLPGIGGSRAQFALKRTLDLVLSSLGLIALAPLLLAISILIKLDSPGPALFVQTRIGSRRKNVAGKGVWAVEEFRIFKFRSMSRDAGDQIHQDYIKSYANGSAEREEGMFKIHSDPRITKVGKWLRRTSLDELPQLINVLKGEMSLIGPRPVPPYEAACYERRHLRRLCALPGVSGLWQVHGRGRTSFEEMIEMDVEYAGKQSFAVDVALLLFTFPAVIRGSGAR